MNAGNASHAAYIADRALLPDGWATNVRLEVDASGCFSTVARDATGHGATRLAGLLVPGMANVHSHAFQRAIAGRTERSGPADDSFWTWRERMYHLLGAIEADEFEAIATAAYAEMLAAGYTSVCEFHYVHHGPGGTPYARSTELADRIVRAARATGIALTLLPVLYQYSDFGRQPPNAGQARFILSFDAYASLVADLLSAYRGDPQITLGVAAHSLRAVAAEDVPKLVALANGLGSDAPIHMHACEQVREVEACVAEHATTPIALLARHVTLDERWCLIHATHATPQERALVSAAGAVVGLCPTTEASLGDGIFPAAEFVRAGGRIAIGTDSNASIDVAEELRWLEYVQRLRARERNAISPGRDASTGRYLYESAARGGAQALGRNAGTIAVGKRADAVVLALPNVENEDALDIAIFKSGAWRVAQAIVGGEVCGQGRFAAAPERALR
ncbi:MAG: formimidoylglutamate deiminase [Candidatus Eremiobacteraeota bacterium]|nr:formimidoylglutamate deiminase [Candidatus Eremiobacteraeota bacterium]